MPSPTETTGLLRHEQVQVDINGAAHVSDDSEDCEDGSWARPPPSKAAPPASSSAGSAAVAPGSENVEVVEKKNVLVAFLTLVISIPALLGSWCWPVLVMGLLGAAASAGAKAFTHSITFGITLALLSNIAQYVFHKRSAMGSIQARRREKGKDAKGHWAVYGPVYVAAASVPLVMADLTRHALQDAGFWAPACNYNTGPECEAHEGCVWSHHDSASYECDNTNFWKPGSAMYYGTDDKLSIVGIIFTVICTWSGYICLFVGVVWAANIHTKLGEIKAQWRLLRASK